MMQTTPLIILISILNLLTSLTIYRDAVDQILGGCTALDPVIEGINKTTCFCCKNKEGTIISKPGEMFQTPMCQSQTDVNDCRVSAAGNDSSDPILITPTSPQNITLSNRAKKILEIRVWNLDDRKGNWTEINGLGMKHLKMVAPDVLSVSATVKERWRGHVMMVTYKEFLAGCSLVKFHGKIVYPFSMDEFKENATTTHKPIFTKKTSKASPSTSFSSSTFTLKSVSSPTISSQSGKSHSPFSTVQTTVRPITKPTSKHRSSMNKTTILKTSFSNSTIIKINVRDSTFVYVTFALLVIMVVSFVTIYYTLRRAKIKYNPREIRLKTVGFEDAPIHGNLNLDFYENINRKENKKEEGEKPLYKRIDSYQNIKGSRDHPFSSPLPHSQQEHLYCEIPHVLKEITDQLHVADVQKNASEDYTNMDLM